MRTPDNIKDELNKAIFDAVEKSGEYQLDRNYGFTRNRSLTMEKVIKLLLSMNGGSLQKELYAAGVNVSASAFCQRRQKIVSTVFEDVFNNFNVTAEADTKRFRGYRLFAVDGTTINMARNKNSSTFLQDGGKGYNAFHLNPIFDILNNTYFSAVIQPQPRMDEIGALTFMLQWNAFPEKSIVILDRGYQSYNMIARLINTANVHFVMRVKHNSKAAMREIQKLPMTDLDTTVSQVITITQTNEDKRENRIFLQTGSKKGKVNSPGTRITRWDFPSPYPLKFRVVRRKLPKTNEYETLITSLPPDVFSADDIVDLYSFRWYIESQFKALKYTVGIANLHAKKDDLVRQEIWAAMTIQNFCSRIVSNVVLAQKDANKYEYAVNYKMAVMLCKEFLRDPNGNSTELLRNIARYTEPIRPGRQDERNMKVKSFPGFCYRIAA